jgi:hypothetical protein
VALVVTAEERSLKMLQRNEIRDPMEAPAFGTVAPETRDELDIEKVLRRAREIHRQHGGMFGYNFEDWAQAWGFLPGRDGHTSSELAEEVEPVVRTSNTEEVCESWFRYDN